MDDVRAGWVVLGTGEKLQLADLGRRLLARILDVILVLVGMGFLFVIGLGGVLLSFFSGAGDAAALAAVALFFGLTLLFVLVMLGYEVTMIALQGQTLGKMVTGIRVVNAADGGLPGWGRAAGRWLVLIVPALIPTVGWLAVLVVCLSPTWGKHRQGLHDKVVSTFVVLA